MNVILKASTGVLVALMLYLTLSKQGKDFSILLTIAVCCIIASAAFEHLKPVLQLIDRLKTVGKLESEMLAIVLKSVGIGMIAETVCMICADAGNASLGKALQFLASCVILWMSVPLFNKLLDIIENIMVAI